MKALVAFDKFKDALSAPAICEIAANALESVRPGCQTTQAPLADGGDGFCDTLVHLAGGKLRSVHVSGPLGQPTEATYGIVAVDNICPAALEELDLPSDAKTLAIVELAQSSGIALVPLADRSPWTTSTYGLGQVIQDAVNNGADAVLVGLGGSSSNDLGLAALQALGFEFSDTTGAKLEEPPVPQVWQGIDTIKKPAAPFPIPVLIACDVENPLLGSNGAAAVFGPQKGLLPDDFASLDSQSRAMAEMLCAACDHSLESLDTSGTGAAGGTAFGLMVGLGGRILSGASLVFAWANIDNALADADVVITGEGRFDKSSLQGKGPGALASKAANENKSVFVFAGSLGTFDPESFPNITLKAISPKDMPIEQALASTEANLRQAIQAAFK